MKMIRNIIQNDNKVYTIGSIWWLCVGRLFVVSASKNKRQWTVNHFQSFTFNNQSAALWCHSKLNALPRVIAKTAIDRLVAPSNNRASTERQHLLPLNPGKPNGYVVGLTHNPTLGYLSRQKCLRQHHHHVLKMSIIRASMIMGHTSHKMQWLRGDNHA